MKVNLFRGRRISDDKWIYGYYVPVTDFESGEVCPMIISADNSIYPEDEIGAFDFVDPMTVGQYMNILDKLGRKVFEGDILQNPIEPSERMLVTDIRDYEQIMVYIADGWTVTHLNIGE